eukprot:3843905-Pyramimonas_sp.AAC.1
MRAQEHPGVLEAILVAAIVFGRGGGVSCGNNPGGDQTGGLCTGLYWPTGREVYRPTDLRIYGST